MEILKRVVLHNPLLLGGTNLQMNLDASKRSGMKILNDEDHEQIYIYYNGEYVKIPHAAVAQMFPLEDSVIKYLFDAEFAKTQAPLKTVKHAPATIAPEAPTKPVSAQVSTPMSHVHGGRGAGKTNGK